MKKNLLKKFTKYTALAGATALAGNANADIVYTDIDPDSTITGVGNTQYEIDINNDNINDFRISCALGTASNLLKMYGLNNNSFKSFISSSVNYVSNLSYNNVISGANDFATSGYVGYAGASSSTGAWNDTKDGYIGVKLDINSEIHYGWFRLDIGLGYDSLTIKDFAYNDIVNASILAGDTGTSADIASNLTLGDTANNVSPLDMELTFAAAANENTVSEYRIFAVKTADVASINLDSARNVMNYAPITPDGSASYSISPEIGGQDVNGDSIVQGVSYTAFVLSVPDGANASNHSLSTSNAITLTYPAQKANNLIAADNSDNYDATDFQFNFDKIDDENSIFEYRVLIVKSASAGVFDITAAELNSNSISIVPTGINISQILPITAKDTDGDDIVVATPYKFFVLCEGKAGALNSLSDASNEVTLDTMEVVDTNTNTTIASQLINQIEVNNNSEYLNVKSINTDLNINKISIITTNGALITATNTNDNNSKINIASLSRGIYFATIETDRGLITKKFIK